ncbi:MAG TPA: carboxymuconolactone decarboxylase family protein [Ideonella sp.]|nr:carboxymuconolactone decarboxylase family protein [Ideonella sp.]
MPRIEPVEAPYSAGLSERFARLVPPGMVPPAIFRAVARNEGLFNHMVDIGLLGPTGLLDRRVLPKALRELLILRTCVAARNDYEWRLHVDTVAPRMGLTPAQIADTRASGPDAALWGEAERAAMALADSLVARLDVDDALYTRLREHFDEATLIEMTQLIGLYTGVAMQVALARPERDRYPRLDLTKRKV